MKPKMNKTLVKDLSLALVMGLVCFVVAVALRSGVYGQKIINTVSIDFFVVGVVASYCLRLVTRPTRAAKSTDDQS